MAYEFTADESLPRSVTRCAREQLDRAIDELSEGIASDPVKAVHTARKAIKKERALLRLARAALPPGERTTDNAILREAARKLSGLRDAEVAIQTLDDLAERFAGQLPQTTFAVVREHLERDRREEHERAGQSEASDDAIRDLHAVRERVDDWKLERDRWGTIAPGLLRSYSDGRDAARQVRKEASVENLHTWRKRVKDLWYEHRLLAPVCGPVVRGGAEEAERLSELLGADHDLAVLRETLVRKAPGVATDLDALIGLVDYRREQLQAQAVALGDRLYAEKPPAFVRRLRRSWKAGRDEFRAFQEQHPAALAQTKRDAAPRSPTA